MNKSEEENIITELNDRFKEMRTLIITIGSILALLMPVVNQMGIIDFGVDFLVDEFEDDNPYLECQEDWKITDSSYVVKDQIILSFRLSDLELCGNSHNLSISIQVDSDGQSNEPVIYENDIKNTRAFTFEQDAVEDGEWIYSINILSTNYEKLLIQSVRLFYVNTVSEEYKVYGCTDYDAINFNGDATDDDGTCEYEVIEENCTFEFYDVQVYWAENNTSIYSDFDVDYTCESYGNVIVELEIFSLDNQTMLLSSTVQYDTYHYEVDYQNIDFYNVTIPHSDYIANFKLKTETELIEISTMDLIRE